MNNYWDWAVQVAEVMKKRREAALAFEKLQATAQAAKQAAKQEALDAAAREKEQQRRQRKAEEEERAAQLARQV